MACDLAELESKQGAGWGRVRKDVVASARIDAIRVHLDRVGIPSPDCRIDDFLHGIGTDVVTFRHLEHANIIQVLIV